MLAVAADYRNISSFSQTYPPHMSGGDQKFTLRHKQTQHFN